MNKRIFAMSAVRKIGFSVAVLALLACEQPLKAGLGIVQDYQPPMVVLEDPSPNDLILGVKRFRGRATDDYHVREVDIRVTNHEYLDHNRFPGERNPLYEYTRVGLDSEGKWGINIDTTKYPDGDFLIQLRVLDSENKRTETQEIRFVVKNMPPSISMEPIVKNGADAGELGGQHLNWDDKYARPAEFTRVLDASGIMTGMITDTIGINRVASGSRFPPQIRFWQIRHGNDSGTSYEDSGRIIQIVPANIIPPETTVPWEPLKLIPLNLSTDIPGALTGAQFQYTLPKTANRVFAFQIRAQSLDTSGTTFDYPRDHWTGEQWEALATEQQTENSMVMVYLRAPDEYPRMAIWALQDITDPSKGTFNSSANELNYPNMSGLDPDGNHVYIDTRNAVKKGPFTLRVRTSHSEGISNAWVYFEKTADPNYRGRFIWDPADSASLPKVALSDVLDYSQGSHPYSTWGFYDGNTRSVRSFIFTYLDTGTTGQADSDETNPDRYPGLAGNMPRIPSGVGNRSKVQRYAGHGNWGDWTSRDEIPDADWEDINKLDEGDYTIHVYTRSLSGTAVLGPETIQLTIDRAPPEIQLNRVIGGVDQGSYHEVNGVVEPRFLVSDARSGLRSSGSAYFTGGAEQRYILVDDDTGKAKMEEYSADGIWPQVPASGSGSPVDIDGARWYKNGPVSNSGCRFIVSDIYAAVPGHTETGALADGTYWLYVFARDKAFNVGARAFRLDVRADGDRPVIDFSVGGIDPGVDDPNYGSPNSFEGVAVTRNRFGSTSNIRVELRDDDSLDLGTNEPTGSPPLIADSSVVVTFVGSYIDSATNRIQPYAAPGYLITLTDAELKAAFGCQNVSGSSRLAVTRRSGTIEQSVLLRRLKENSNYDYLFGGDKAAYTSLPDGMYKVSVSVSDYAANPDIKLIMPGGVPPTARAVSATEDFWIAVDTKRPHLDQAAVTPPSSSYIMVGDFPAGELVPVSGTVSDENGPIALALLSVIDGDGNDASDIVDGDIAFVPTGNTKLWEYVFTIPLNIGKTGRRSGTFTINVSFTDRFGNITTLSQQYMADNEPPSVGLTMEIETFERDLAGMTLNGNAVPDPEVNRKRLANKVVSFTVSASDNFAVDRIRWWLLPAATTPPVNFDGYAGALTNGKRGDINMAASQFSVYVDTGAWADGLYSLYVMAVDAADNYSQGGANGHRYQQVYLLQDEDKPYFDTIGPNGGVVGQADLFVRGRIMDDDGFGDGTTIAADSIRIWFSNNAGASSDTENITVDSTGLSGYIGPVRPVSGMQPQGRDISLSLDLQALFPGKITGDGVKHFIIEAQDAVTNKKVVTNAAANTGADSGGPRVTRRRHFSFMYDTVLPKVELSTPRTGQTFGPSAGNMSADPSVRFDITGWFEDGNLKKNVPDQPNNYYLTYELDSWLKMTPPKPAQIIDLTAGSHVVSVAASPNPAGGTRVNFTIPANIVTGLLDFDALDEGTHTLTLSVDDLSGKTGRVSVSFIKDLEPPTFEFTNVEIKRPLENLGETPIGNWWVKPNILAEQHWNEAKWDYLAEEPGVSTIYYDPGATPVLTGTFEDSISSVDATFQYWIDSEPSPRTGTVSGSGRNVSWSAPLTKLPSGDPLDDGVHTIRISVKDLSGNIIPAASDLASAPPKYGSDMMFAFRIDSRRPEASIDMAGRRSVYGADDRFYTPGPNDANAGAQSEPAGRVFTVRGRVTDANIREVQLRIVSNASGNPIQIPVDTDSLTLGDYAIPASARDYTTGLYPVITLNWAYGVTSDRYCLWPDGSYDVVVVGIDHWGNESEEAIWTFIKDAAGPRVEFSSSLKTSVSSLQPRSLDSANSNILSADDLKIQGSAVDALSAIAGLQSRLERWDYNGAWVEEQPWQDIPGIPSGSMNIQWEQTVSASGDLADGLYRIRVRARDSAYVRTGDDGWSYDGGSRGNPVESSYVYFYYDRSGPGITFNMDNFISSRNRDGQLMVPVTVRDDNRIKTIVAQLLAMDNTPIAGKNATFSYTDPSAEANWPAERMLDVTIPVPYQAGSPGYLADGQYRLRVTATDWAGKPNTVTTNFFLDNNQPMGEISAPREWNRTGYLAFASEILLGGEDSEIRGTSRDDGGSASGVDAIWYYLGFPENNPAYNANPSYDSIARTVLGGTATAAGDTGLNNDAFDRAAAATTTLNPGDYKGAWFKLAQGYDGPPGFNVTPNVYDWAMAIPNIYGTEILPRGGLKPYGGAIEVKGETYNTGARRLSVQVPAGDIGGNPSIVRMPLFLRIADRVGNISYLRRDILFNPDGDIPNTSILNPEASTGSGSRRAGAISVDGLARNNWSVQSVVFRVLADGNANSTPASPGSAPSNVIPAFSNMQRLSGDSSQTGREELDFIAAAGYTREGWHFATLDAYGSPEAPWSFIINSEQEISSRIASWGFKSSPGLASNDTIRVWIQVFVFRGNGQATLMSIGDPGEGGSISAPIPYARFFYLKESAPTISDLRIGSAPTATALTDSADAYAPGGAEVRSGRFALRATLDAAAGQRLTEVWVRRMSEDTPMPWTKVWENELQPNGAWVSKPLNNVPGLGIRAYNGANPGGANQKYYLDYYFDSSYSDDAAPSGYSAVNNNQWRYTGGRFAIEIRIADNAGMGAGESAAKGEASYALNIGVDNFTPVADTRLQTPKRVAGSNVDFLGRVFDYSSAMIAAAENAPAAFVGSAVVPTEPHGRVYAWFTKQVGGNTYFINLDNGLRSDQTTAPGYQQVYTGSRTNVLCDCAATVSGDPAPSITVTNNGSVGTVINYPATSSGSGAAFAVGSSAVRGSAWVREISEFSAGPGTRMVWDSNRDRDVTWMFNIDTTVLPDGPLTLNYIVTDRVGNAAFYQQGDIFVRNKYPQIDRVTLYTDNNGVGAVYTTHDTSNIASTEYFLDAYQGQMFAGLDDGDSTTINQTLAKSRGYLNSGFISKNQFIGFGVESSLGNPNLHYRLQYVKREMIQLTRDNLQAMITNKNSASPEYLNLYTIAWNGGFGATRWQSVFNVPTAAPQVGTHFVLQLNEMPSQKEFSDTSAWVWRYKPVLSRDDVTLGQDGMGNNLPVLPNDLNPPPGAQPGHGFNFSGPAHFDLSNPAKINERDATSPDNTAFFLIRAWDSVNPGSGENDQLYDALVIGMRVYLEDKERPTVRLYDLNPYTEESVTGNNIGVSTDPLTGIANSPNTWLTIRNALNPGGLGENIRRGGLYNASTRRELLVKSGHIEPRTGTNALRPLVRDSAGMQVSGGVDASGFVPGSRNADGFVTGDSASNSLTGNVQIARDMVSGKVILRGEAYDNQLIKEIRVYIGTEATLPPTHDLYDPESSAGQALAILRLDPDEPKLIPNPNAGSPGEPDQILNPYYRALKPISDPVSKLPTVQAWIFQDMHWRTGHTVEWAYVWDTETRPNASGTPAGDVRVWVAVIDQADSASRLVTEANQNTKNTFAVDIVPYVTGFERQQPRYATKRSLQGWYSFFQGEQNITALGYNLKGAGATAMSIRSSSGGTSITLTPRGTQSINRVGFDVPATNVASGKIILNTGVTVPNNNIGSEALNHRSNSNQSWNREYFYNTPGSELWNNKPYAHIWRSQESSSAPYTYFASLTPGQGSHELQSPGMALQYTGTAANNTTGAGRLHGVWAVYASAGWYYGVNDGNNRTNQTTSQSEPYSNTDIGIYLGGNNTTAVSSLSSTATHAQDGQPYVIYKHGSTSTTSSNNTLTGTSGAGPTQRWQNSRVSRGAAADSTYFSFYDSQNKSLWFGRNDGNTLRIDGNAGSSAITPTGIGASSNAGEYSAIDYVTNGSATAGATGSLTVPVIAYYDQEHDTVRVAVGTATQTTSSAWFRRYLLPEGHALRRGSGKYISVKVDKNNGIHLAFFNSNRSAIVYAYARNVGYLTGATPTPPSTGPLEVGTTNFYVAIVDTVVKGGIWTDISVDNYGNPWIVYGDIGRTGNYDGVRMAYRSSANTGFAFAARPNPNVSDTPLRDKVSGADITGWEAVQMPADYRINNDRLNIEAWPPTDRRSGTNTLAASSPDGGWNAAVGYASDLFRIAYFYYPAWKDY